MGSSAFLITETPAGYGVLKAANSKLFKLDKFESEIASITDAFAFKDFKKFESAALALEEVAALKKGQVPPVLASLLEELNKNPKTEVAVADVKLGNAISQLPDLDIKAVSGTKLSGIFRSVREHLDTLIPPVPAKNLEMMALGLAHSASRHRLKFSGDKVDSMIIHAVKTLDDLDKEVNTYAMRMREWYYWHFPELSKIIEENSQYASVVLVGSRDDIANGDLTEFLPAEMADLVTQSANMSVGKDFTAEDLAQCKELARNVKEMLESRQKVTNYLQNRMRAIAPNLTQLVGFLVGARLISHVGSLVALAKAPASTIQILGAEKALFRALKTKHDTPKYGLIYHSSLVGKASGKAKGKIARMLAAKSALGVRIDAMERGESEDLAPEERSLRGAEWARRLERRLNILEGRPAGPSNGISIGPDGQKLQPGELKLREKKIFNQNVAGIATGSSPANGTARVKSKSPMIMEVDDEDTTMADAGPSKKRKTEKSGAESSSKKSKAKAEGAGGISDADAERYAEAMGIKVKKFWSRYQSGRIVIENGVPKKVKKSKGDDEEEEEEEPAKPKKESKKRKHEAEDEAAEVEPQEKKHKKKKSKKSKD